MQSADQHNADTENCMQVLYHTHFNDILTEYPAWSTDTNDIANTNEAKSRENRQDIQAEYTKCMAKIYTRKDS